MNIIDTLLAGARHRERFLRVHANDGVRKYCTEDVGALNEARRCDDGVTIKRLAPHMYNLFMTTIVDGKIAVFMDACVDETGTIHDNCVPDEQTSINKKLASIYEDIVGINASVDYWDLVNHEPVPHQCSDTSGECLVCAKRVCPFEEPMHLHHDGCPTCSNLP